MPLFLVLGACSPSASVAESAPPEDSAPDPAPTVVRSAHDEAMGVLPLAEFVHLVGPISDRDGDGRADLLLSDGAVVAPPSGTLAEGDLVLQQYGGVFSTYYGWDLMGAPDLDGDGLSELVAFYTTSQSAFLGVFSPDVENLDTDPPIWEDEFGEYWQGGFTYFDLVDGLSGAGPTDVELSSYDGSGGTFLGRRVLRAPTEDNEAWAVEGLPWWGQAGTYDYGFPLIGVDDIDGDGLRDFVWVGHDLAVWSGMALGEVEFEPPLAWITATKEGEYATWPIHSGDFDGDGHAEIAATGPSGVIVLAGVDHDQTLDDATFAAVDGPDGAWFRLTDADENGQTDILLYGRTEADVWLAPFAGAMGPNEASIRWQLDNIYNAAWVGDLDADGLQELVIEDDGMLLTLSA